MSGSAYKTSKGRLREAGVHRIHDLVDGGMTYQKAAEEMGVSLGTVYNIRNGITWGDVLAERRKPAA